MGWLRKKGRQLDKRIRKIFSKKAWLKIAALVATFYMGIKPGGFKGPGGGNVGQFFNNLGSGIKNIFWNPKGGVGGKGGLTWAGQVGTNVGTNVAVGVAQGKLMEGPMTGQQAGFAPQENTAINKAVAASNAAYGNVGNILDAYRNFDFGPGSTTMLVDSARNRNIRSSYLPSQIT